MSIDYTYLMTLIKMNQFSKAKILFETYDIDEISDKFIGDAFDHETDIFVSVRLLSD